MAKDTIVRRIITYVLICLALSNIAQLAFASLRGAPLVFSPATDLIIPLVVAMPASYLYYLSLR